MIFFRTGGLNSDSSAFVSKSPLNEEAKLKSDVVFSYMMITGQENEQLTQTKVNLFIKVLLSFFLVLGVSYNSVGQPPADSLLKVLKVEIRKKQSYDQAKENRINALKFKLSRVPATDFSKQYLICNQIFEEYKDFKFDSAFVYVQKLLQISKLTDDLSKQFESKIKLGSIQLSGGMFKETFDCLRQINTAILGEKVKLKYYSLKSRALWDLAAYNRSTFSSPANRVRSMAVLDSAIALTLSGSYENYKMIAEREALYGRPKKAIGILRMLMVDSKYTSHQRAMAANDLSHLTTGEEKNRLITLAAIYDIRSSTKQTLAVFTLGKQQFSTGNVNDAILLLREALDQATFYGNKPRAREVTAILTQASAQKLIDSENSKNQLLTILIVIAAFVLSGLALISFIVYTRLKRVKVREQLVHQRNQQLDHINKKLMEDARIKEEYIGYFFNVISGYILKLAKIKRNTERKIKEKNYEDLLQIAREIDIKAERENLFYTFDHVFLKLFPNFIDTFNSLLKHDDQIFPKENELLNTSLRIFALMRLGISDTQTIANILETAVSTVYTYRNRIKSKAILQGDDFDQQIMQIKFVDIS
ncbi:hypothetical protein ABIB40_000855 [Pedobacter sp. UYP30]|uniref:DUF6377 domain-containing protein n=1 Tax=Pedobacter sp. UYP30 TaxID=1756400 RepID=UPI00339B687C